VPGATAPPPLPPLPTWPPRHRARPATKRHWSLHRWIVVVGAVSALFAITGVGFGSYALARLSDARNALIGEVHPALRASQDLATAMANQENAVRGFGLTAREEFLTPYLDGIQAAQQAVDELRLLADTRFVGNLQEDLNAVLVTAQTWRSKFAIPTIETVRASGQPVGGAMLENNRLLFEQLRADLTALQRGLNDRLGDATRRLNDATAFLRAVFIVIGLVLAVLALAVGSWLRFTVTRPLSRLAGEVRQVVSGDAHRLVRGRGPREVVELAANIDAMRRHILAELDALEIAHQRLDEQARDLERSNRDLEQFAYVASHDLQEPLRKVSSFCQLLKRRYSGQLDERADSYIAFAVDGASRMQRLINDLLAFSRVGRSASGFEAVDLGTVAEAALAQLETVREEVGAAITVEPLPTVHGDASLLTQLLANLVGNALKFRRPDLRPEVRISAHRRPDSWELSVADNGIGVEPEYADKVFVIFQRLHAREAYPGTGIGLAMAKKIVEYHGGRIWLDPDRTDGATVSFTLAPESAEEPAEEPAAESAADPEGRMP
jgi:signal transduction histidine kinase